MPKNSRKNKYWKKKPFQGPIKTLISICLALMVLSQAAIGYNRSQINWFKKGVMNVTASETSDLIIATDQDNNRAGAMNYKGEIVIPFENSIFDPWTGELITESLYHEENLYWINQDGKVGIVNAENKEIIPQEYGYLERALENQFIAGDGTLSEAVSGGGQYIHKKYGVVAEGGISVIPIEYDELNAAGDNKYYGVIYGDSVTIKRSFRTDGTMVSETKEEPEEPETEIEAEEETEVETDAKEVETEAETETETEMETESEADTEADTETETDTEVQTETWEEENNETETKPQETSSQAEDSAQKESAGETDGQLEETQETETVQGRSDIETYVGTDENSEILEKYNEGKERVIHYYSGTTTLELKEQPTVLVEFPGTRTPEVNEPYFSEDEKLVIDEWEEQISIYSTNDGKLLCTVNHQTEYQQSGSMIAYVIDNMYEVKNLDNRLLFTVEIGEDDQYMNSALEKPRFVFQEGYFVYQGDTGRTLVTEEGVVVARDLDVIYFNMDETQNQRKEKIFICEKDDKFGAFAFSGEKILDFIYQNVEFFTGHVSALRVTDEKGKVGVTDYSGQLIIPIEYDNVGYGVNVQGADSQQIETYTLLHLEGYHNRYFGQKNDEIFYLDDNGQIVSRVQYVAKQEKSGGGFFDLLALQNQMENQVLYRVTGNQKVMTNAFGAGITYRRCQIKERINNNGIAFLCIDPVGSRVGVYDYTFNAFTLMGYQQNIYNLWLFVSRLFVVLFIIFFFSGIPVGDLWDRAENSIFEWRKKNGKKK